MQEIGCQVVEEPVGQAGDGQALQKLQQREATTTPKAEGTKGDSVLGPRSSWGRLVHREGKPPASHVLLLSD